MTTTTTTTTATGTARFSDWDEEPGWGPESPLPRLSHAQVTFTYEGDLVGASASQSVLSYGPDGAGTGLGFESFSGTIGGVEGGFVLQHVDRFGPEGVTTEWTIVEGSGTGGLAGITGSGGYEVGHGTSEWTYTLAYRLSA